MEISTFAMLRPGGIGRRRRGSGTVHFRVPAIRDFSVNTATAATILNANMVNARSMWLKLPVFWQKNAVWGRFLALKNTVNYSSRFELTMRFRLSRDFFRFKSIA
jgi:hypothetical protein